jgi:hypothetical protein
MHRCRGGHERHALNDRQTRDQHPQGSERVVFCVNKPCVCVCVCVCVRMKMCGEQNSFIMGEPEPRSHRAYRHHCILLIKRPRTEQRMLHLHVPCCASVRDLCLPASPYLWPRESCRSEQPGLQSQTLPPGPRRAQCGPAHLHGTEAAAQLRWRYPVDKSTGNDSGLQSINIY